MVSIINVERHRSFPNLKALTQELTEEERLGLVLIYNNLRFLEIKGKEKRSNESLYEIMRISSHLKRRRIILGSHKEHSFI